MSDTASSEAVIFFSGPIAPDMCESLLRKVSNFAQQGHENIHLLMSSEGGDIHLAIAVYNILRGFRTRISAYNVSVVGSAAMIVFLAAERRYATTNATFFLHETTTTMNTDSWQLRTAQNLVSGISDNEERINALIAERTGQRRSVVKSWASNIAWFDHVAAKEHGIIDDFDDLDFCASHEIEYVLR